MVVANHQKERSRGEVNRGVENADSTKGRPVPWTRVERSFTHNHCRVRCAWANSALCPWDTVKNRASLLLGHCAPRCTCVHRTPSGSEAMPLTLPLAFDLVECTDGNQQIDVDVDPTSTTLKAQNRML